MCDALIKMAIFIGSKGVDSYKDTSPQPMPLHIIIENAKVYLKNANQILEHEDPDGPEAGGLLAGATQLQLSLAQFG